MKKTSLSPKMQKAAGAFVFLLIFIMVCAFLAQYLTGSETLQDYADNNPELAYGPPESSEPPDAVSDSSPTEPSSTGHVELSEKSSDATGPAESPEKSSAAGPTESPEKPSNTAGPAETSDKPSAYNTSEESAADSANGAEPHTQRSDSEKEEMSINPERTTYQNGFYYEPLSEAVKKRITGISYPESGCTVPYEDLNYVGLLYVDFNGEVQTGELICNKAIAQDMVEIFYELYLNDYRLERVRLIDEYGGDDTLSMEDNNTSCFNYRVVDGTTSLSKHALGCAIDINPFYNPYVVYNRPEQGQTYISPKGSEIYADRSQNFPYKIDENDLCYKLFTAHGFTWGGNWNSSKDYQHFQIVL